MKMRFFDFEVFPHWWCCVFGDMPDDLNDISIDLKDNFKVVTSNDFNARDNLMNMFFEEDYVLCGYNIKRYDLAIANAIYQGFTPEQVKIVNDIIINPGCAYSTKEHIRLQSFANKKLNGFVYQDLMDDGEGSLKEKEAVMGLNILESDVDFNKEDLTDEDIADVIYYCKQDVYAAMYFYKDVVHPYTLTKLAMGKRFNIPEKTCRTSTNARLVAIALKAKRRPFADADKIEIELPKKIRDYCYENVPSKILQQLLTSTDSLHVRLFDNEVDYGNGGIHSVFDTNLYIESDDEYTLINVDATSYYPSMLIQFDCLSRCVEDRQVFIDIFDERVAIKHKPDKTKEDEEHQMADKLVLNTTFGASGNKFLDLYDPHLCTRTCRLGQIFLTALACKMTKTIPSIKIIQTNTDGILAYVRRADLPKVEACMNEWTAVSGINMDRDDIVKIWQRDVNNYLLVKNDNGKLKVKRKGGWLNDDYHKPGYVMVGSLNAFVCAKAAQKFLLEGIDPVETIIADKNVMDFVMTCKKGPSYSKVVQRFADGHEEELFKCNRVIASKDKSLGKVYKIKKYKDRLSYTQMAGIPDNCRLMNEALDSYKFEDIKNELDYMFYVQKTADLLDIQWKQIKGQEIKYIDNFKYE